MTNTPSPSPSQLAEEDFPEWARDLTKLYALFSPTQDRIVIVPDAEKKVTAGGLMMASSSKGKIEALGTVVAVGTGKHSEYADFKIPMEIKVGQRVQYARFAGDDYFLDESGHWTEWASVGRAPTGTILIKLVREPAILQAWPLSTPS